VDAEQEIKMLIQAIGLLDAAPRGESGDQVLRDNPEADELPPIRRARRERPTQEEPPTREEQEQAIPRRPLAWPSWPAWLVLSRQRAAVAAAVFLVSGITLTVGVTVSVGSRRGDAVDWVRPSSPPYSVPRVNPSLISDGTAIPHSAGKRPRRTASDVEIELLERKLEQAIRRDGLVIPELETPSEPPAEGGPRSVRVAKASSS
jgi:hypothetical protein